MCWPLSDGSSKFIPIDEEPNHQIVHAFRLGKAQRATHQPLDPGPEIDGLALDFLRVLLAYVMLLGSEMPLIGPPAVGVILGDAKGLSQLLQPQPGLPVVHAPPGRDPHADEETPRCGAAPGATPDQPGAPPAAAADRACQQQRQAVSHGERSDPPVESGRARSRDGALLCPAQFPGAPEPLAAHDLIGINSVTGALPRASWLPYSQGAPAATAGP